MAPAAAAMPRTNAAAITPHRTPDFAAVAWVIGSCGVLCANTAPAIITMTRANKTSLNLLITYPPFLKSCEVINCEKSVFFHHGGPGQVDHRQHDEDEGLKKGAEDAQPHHRPGNDKGKDPHEDPGGGVLAEDIAEQAHPEREDTGEVPDDLDGNHQRRQNGQGPHEVFEVVHDALRPEALPVVVEKRGDGQSEGRIRIARGRLQKKEDPEDVRDE